MGRSFDFHLLTLRSKLALRSALNVPLKRLGYVPATPSRRRPDQVPVGSRAGYVIGHPSELVFEVDLGRCVSYLHFSFHSEGWHPYVACLRQLGENDALSYRDSVLREYYDRFRPVSQCEAYFEQCNNSIEPLNRRSPYEVLEPWSSHQRRFKEHSGHGNQNFGPVSAELGRAEMVRLQRLRDSIARRGFLPETFGYIEGFFLRSGDDYRFHITNGFHRAAVLTTMGFQQIRALFSPKMPRIVDIADIEHWPQVEDGELAAEVARMVFMRHFEENGLQKARNIGMT